MKQKIYNTSKYRILKNANGMYKIQFKYFWIWWDVRRGMMDYSFIEEFSHYESALERLVELVKRDESQKKANKWKVVNGSQE